MLKTLSRPRWQLRIPRFGSQRFWLTVAGLLPLLGLLNQPPDTMLPIFSIYVAFVWLRRPLAGYVAKLPLPGWAAFALVMTLTGFLTEILAWTGSYLAAEKEPALFHPQLGADLLSSIPFYGMWTLGWLFLRTRYGYTVKERFFYQGLYGVLVEQLGAVLLAGLLSMPVGLILWLYVFLVYGSAAGMATMPFDADFTKHADRAVSRKRKTIVTFAVMLCCTFIVAAPIYWAIDASDILPPKQDIRAHPWW